jgi:hypothetical protein
MNTRTARLDDPELGGELAPTCEGRLLRAINCAPNRTQRDLRKPSGVHRAHESLVRHPAKQLSLELAKMLANVAVEPPSILP